jgi:hypothetical protein
VRRLAIVALLVLAPAPAAADDVDRFARRTIVIPSYGFGSYQVDARRGTGMTIGALLQRTFDRLEVQADYTVADWQTDPDEPAFRSAITQRAGAGVRVQALRKRVESLTLDATLEANLGWQFTGFRDGDSTSRPDLALGIGLRNLTDLMGDDDPAETRRLWLGMELHGRVILAPAPGGGVETSFVLLAGMSVGR